jgi:hypothetical protein
MYLRSSAFDDFRDAVTAAVDDRQDHNDRSPDAVGHDIRSQDQLTSVPHATRPAKSWLVSQAGSSLPEAPLQPSSSTETVAGNVTGDSFQVVQRRV